jgi:ATP-binding cassette subfamily B protein
MVYKIHISYPATQRVTLTKEEFENCWLSSRNSQDETGVALMLEPSPTFRTIEDDFKPNKKTYSHLPLNGL